MCRVSHPQITVRQLDSGRTSHFFVSNTGRAIMQCCISMIMNSHTVFPLLSLVFFFLQYRLHCNKVRYCSMHEANTNPLCCFVWLSFVLLFQIHVCVFCLFGPISFDCFLLFHFQLGLSMVFLCCVLGQLFIVQYHYAALPQDKFCRIELHLQLSADLL